MTFSWRRDSFLLAQFATADALISAAAKVGMIISTCELGGCLKITREILLFVCGSCFWRAEHE
jgi:hypothetical protein